jgi:xylulokinase
MSRLKYIFVIDVGSSVCKTTIYTMDFRIVERAYREIPTTHPKPTWAEQNPEDWWRAVVETVKVTLGKTNIDLGRISGIGVCGQSHGPVLIDGNGKPIYPCIVWPDLRAVSQAERLRDATGRNVQAYYTAAKLLWLRENRPDLFEKVHRLLLPKDYVRMMLTGVDCTDLTDASGTQMYDPENGCWDKVVLEAVGISENILPRVYPSDAVIGRVSAKVASETGLEEGTPVIAGAGDAYSLVVGLQSILTPERAIIYLGTAPAVFTFTKELKKNVLRWVSLKEGYVLGGFIGVGGSSIKWLRLLLDCTRLTYEAIDSEAEAVGSSEGLLFLPHLMGERMPFYNPYARGVIFGLALGHRRGHIALAMIEGVTYQLLETVEDLALNGEIREIVVVGGGAKSRVWRQVISDIFSLPVGIPEDVEASSLGLAYMTSVGLGLYKDTSEAAKRRPLRIVNWLQPRMERHGRYLETYRLYRKLQQALHFTG